MSRSDELVNDIGGYLNVSSGERGDDVPVAEPVPVSGEFKGRMRHRQACRISLDRIIADPNQPRKTFPQDELEQLAHSLRTKGQLQPIRVRWDEKLDRYVILMGERRLRAGKLAGLKQLDCVIHEEELSETEIAELALIENCIRQDLNPIEQAIAFQGLMSKRSISSRQLAQELRMNASTVLRCVSLLKLPESIQQEIIGGRIPPGVAREIVKLEDEESQQEMARQYLAGELTTASAAAAVSRKKGKEKAKGPTTKKEVVVGPGRKVLFTSRKRETVPEIIEGLRAAIEILESSARPRSRAA